MNPNDHCTTLIIRDTIQSADCVENCPIDGFQNIFTCGTYQLIKNKEINKNKQNIHLGTVQVFDRHSDTNELKDIQKIEFNSGIFDMKWSNQLINNKAMLGLATTDGTIEIYQLDQFNKSLQHSVQGKHMDRTNENEKFISLDWNNKIIQTNEPSIAVSQSNGMLSLWKYSNSNLSCIKKWKAHDLFGTEIEVWITSFNHHNPSILYSGGDDCTLKGWDIRNPINKPIFNNKDTYQMGVCSIISHPSKEHIFASGSYDETIHLWDERNMKKPITHYHTGGGVWRLKWSSYFGTSDESLLLAACMHNGFQLFEIQDTKDIQLKRIAWNKEHASLAYGVDFCYHTLKQKENSIQISSCSFYDHKYSIWETPLE